MTDPELVALGAAAQIEAMGALAFNDCYRKHREEYGQHEGTWADPMGGPIVTRLMEELRNRNLIP